MHLTTFSDYFLAWLGAAFVTALIIGRIINRGTTNDRRQQRDRRSKARKVRADKTSDTVAN